MAPDHLRERLEGGRVGARLPCLSQVPVLERRGEGLEGVGAGASVLALSPAGHHDGHRSTDAECERVT